MQKLRVNMVSESEHTTKAHGVHTAYVEMATALEKRDDVELIRGEFTKLIDCDIVHIHTVGPMTWPKLFQRGPKKVISAHVVPDSFIGSFVLAKHWSFAARWYLRWFYGRADLLLAVSEETRRDLLAMGVTSPIEVITNSVDTEKYQKPAVPRDAVRKKLGIPENAFVVIGAGQVQPRKRVDSFINAARKLPNVSFVWMGGVLFGAIASEGSAMRRLMDSAPENVIFPGVVPLEEMVSYYHAADLFWLPSDQETFGLVVVEAAASGLPVMVRDIPDYDATFGEDALRVNDKTSVSAITELRDNPARYKAWQQRAKSLATRYDSKRTAEQLVKLYGQLVN